MKDKRAKSNRPEVGEPEAESPPHGTPEPAASMTPPGETGEVSADAGVSSEEIASLRARATERDTFLDLLQRTRAEFANYQRRVERDRETWSREAVARFVSRLIPFLDDVERALLATRESKDLSSVERGLAMMEKSFRSVLVDEGVQPIEAVGAPFDPRLHEAIEQRTTADQPDGTVIDEMRKGYVMGDRVLRPAHVVVSRREKAES